MTDSKVSASPVQYDCDDAGVGVIQFSRPDAANVMGIEAARAFAAAAQEAAGARVVIVRSTGRFFCAGGDLRSFAGTPDVAAPVVRETAECLHDALRALRRMDAPVVAEVQGVAAGAGLSIAIAADLVVAAAGVSFVFGYSAAGLSPDCGASASLARLIGVRRAFEFAVSNRRMPAEEAHDLGLVNHVVGADELAAFTSELAARLADGPTRSYGALKRLLDRGAVAPFEEQLDMEVETLVERAVSPEGQEGIAAFLEKRAADFRST